MIKKFIRGNKERGQEVIKALEDLGGINKHNLTGDDIDYIYLINIDNNITRWDKRAEFAIVIQELYEEIKLKDKKVVTNKQFADWYFNQLFISEVVQYKFNDEDIIRTRMYDYLNDDDLTPVKYIRINFGEWLPIEEIGIITDEQTSSDDMSKIISSLKSK